MDRYIQPDDRRYSDRARSLVAIGRSAIAKADDAALDAFFAPDFVFHGPSGDVGLDRLKAVFAAMRAAFSDFACDRLELIEQGDLIAARTIMTGVFDAPLTGTAWGTLQPTHRPVSRELMNVFRFDPQGRLAEEWAQYDELTFLKRLGGDLEPSDAVRAEPVHQTDPRYSHR